MSEAERQYNQEKGVEGSLVWNATHGEAAKPVLVYHTCEKEFLGIPQEEIVTPSDIHAHEGVQSRIESSQCECILHGIDGFTAASLLLAAATYPGYLVLAPADYKPEVPEDDDMAKAPALEGSSKAEAPAKKSALESSDKAEASLATTEPSPAKDEDAAESEPPASRNSSKASLVEGQEEKGEGAAEGPAASGTEDRPVKAGPDQRAAVPQPAPEYYEPLPVAAPPAAAAPANSRSECCSIL
ncbi:hypothetical protein GGF46_002415 [Coemansia sp. RSA 552]|nr:hypothetical protein GGF46_002415 [Coemansia sp. RSA 552]